MNCLWLGNTKETVSQIKVCVMYDMRFTRMNCLRWDKRIETVQYNKYHKYCKVQIQRLQRPNSNIANRVISEKGLAADKSCMGLTQRFPITHMFASYHTHLVHLNRFCSHVSTQIVHPSEPHAVYHTHLWSGWPFLLCYLITNSSSEWTVCCTSHTPSAGCPFLLFLLIANS